MLHEGNTPKAAQGKLTRGGGGSLIGVLVDVTWIVIRELNECKKEKKC